MTDLKEHTIFRFVAQLTSVGGHVAFVHDLEGARRYLVKLVASSKAKQIVVCGRGLGPKLIQPEPASESLEIAIEGYMPREKFFAALKSADIGVTLVDLAVAETGTIILTTSDESERLATALPRMHVALLPRSKLVMSLRDADAHVSKLLSGPGRGNAVSLISGPSRTADIEGRLVVGVHGPRELHVCLLDQDFLGGP